MYALVSDNFFGTPLRNLTPYEGLVIRPIGARIKSETQQYSGGKADGT